jgi:hypothetical protein
LNYNISVTRTWRNHPMSWETPSFIEIDMNAEIGAYQGDFEDI